VQGRGIQKLREAGIDVSVGVLEEECKALNKRFMTFHGKQRPFVTLKWAESEDGFIDGHISNTYTQMVCHKRRAEHQAILVGRKTWEADKPSLTVREWYGSSPKRYVVSSQSLTLPDGFHLIQTTRVEGILKRLYEDGIQTVLVEGGAELLQSFIDSGEWDECYVEKGDLTLCGRVKAPVLSNAALKGVNTDFGQRIEEYVKQ
jgi:diaminohydroxyphosphoribosylaminopyrimidine deaminase/5-amino-6-(5-phosphoribosylamino)uracil reductase